jgi:hypothetical protein
MQNQLQTTFNQSVAANKQEKIKSPNKWSN